MKDNMMWAYLIHLGTNMWGDQGSTSEISPYHEKLETDDEIWREVVDFLPSQGINTLLIDLGDAVCYESHPELAIAGAWSKKKLADELDRIRSLGMTPLPKLNFSACHDAWLGIYSRMLSTPEYYKVCADLIAETSELFGHPAYFHLGLDEETAENQRGLNYAVIRQGQLWWHDCYFLFDACEKAGARPWVWADPVWHNPEDYLKNMPKSVLQSNWYYGSVKRNPDGTVLDDGSSQARAYMAYLRLDEAGYEQVPTSSTWSNWWNSLHTMRLCKESLNPDRLMGFMTAPWEFTYPSTYYALLNDAVRFGEARKKIYGA
jgi:hypothetical protein